MPFLCTEHEPPRNVRYSKEVYVVHPSCVSHRIYRVVKISHRQVTVMGVMGVSDGG